jgi:FkbM family methyltransferase
MLISYEELQKYIAHLKITGVLHIGAHECEEMDFYKRLGLTENDVCWIDALDEKVALAKSRGIPHIYQAVVTERDDDTVTFNITNNGQSSSIFEFGTHAENYKWCVVTEKRTLKTSRIDTMAKKHSWPIERYNFWNLDIQGAELLALKSAGDILKTVDVIYTEVNIEEVYKGCAQLDEIDNYLRDFGFERVATTMMRENWGDALYIRSPQKISLCIATMDRWSFLRTALPQYLDMYMIDEIVISDENGRDCDEIFKAFGLHPKLRLYSNESQLGAFLNKQKAVSYARNAWVAVIDSDNLAPPSYFSAALRALGDPRVVHMPSRLLAYKSSTEFDHRKFIGRNITQENVAAGFDGAVETLLQSGNFVCSKSMFMKATASYGLERQCNGLDALYKSCLLLRAGAILRVTPGMEYYHAVHDGSVTLQSFKTDFQINKPLFMNQLLGRNPWVMSLRHWIAVAKPLSQWLVNCSEFDHMNDDFVPFPIGMSWQAAALEGDLTPLVTFGSHNQAVLCAIWPDTDNRRRGSAPVNRRTILANLARNGIENRHTDYLEYIRNLKEYKFVISPEGNGVDTHRTYEALMAGCIPIVEENSMMKIKYPNMPILYTTDYSEINKSQLESVWNSMLDKVYDFSPLFLSYYDKATQEQIKLNSDYWCTKVAKRVWKHAH